MISKAKSCSGGTALFNYVVNEKKGYELLRNDLSGTTPKDLFLDMMVFQQQNLRCINNTISIVLSPTVFDSKRMSNDDLKNVTEDFLKTMNLDPKTNQYIAFVHTEKEHKHVHILMNRVKMDGTLINDSFISKKAQTAAHEVAIRHNLTSAKDLKERKEIKNKLTNIDLKKEIKNAHFNVLKTKPSNLKEYQQGMAKFGIQVLPTINKQGTIQGYRFLHESSGTNLKASEVDRNLKLNELFSNENKSKIELQITDPVFHEWKVNTKVLDSLLPSFSNEIAEDIDDHLKIKRKKKRKGLRR